MAKRTERVLAVVEPPKGTPEERRLAAAENNASSLRRALAKLEATYRAMIEVREADIERTRALLARAEAHLDQLRKAY